MKRNKITLIVVLFLALITLVGSIYVVDETEQVVVTQFGKPVGEAVTTPGLNFKVPFIQTANFFEKRYMEWDGDPNQIPTKDKKYIFVDTYARWQIVDPLQFFIRLRNELGAQSRLDDILDGETRDFIANHNLIEAVRTSNRQPMSSGVISEMIGDSLEQIDVGREKIQAMILQAANEQTADLGIKVMDFRLKRINYVEDVRTQVYERMKSERYRIADKFRSEGQGEASRINGEKERELKSIQSAAFREAEEIMGRADGEAAAIYSNAYNRSSASRTLYTFMKSMETFEKTFDDQTHVILSTDSELYKYLKGSR
ncbi:protease modulator HflC [Marinilabilia salmonicolor]|jgi:membrane protease subunit HflC|uniref:Protein HflC n=1 Tax=Marinilabilia salmonicolor TaxID=989 RepID=A0A2T0XFM7_9BACT|nr:protease modulator HflC [Marinilabilia salmonicolor]PRY97758.1 protease FtsH subunit HflC [Marinilabilia salmonicolor]RCW34619.1 protease FtsH subunit HflC [Marinilabilia salmonicolor]